MSIIRGREKFFAALLGGGMATAATILAQWTVSANTGAFEAPSPEEIRGAVNALVATIFAAAGAYIATNSPTEESLTRHRAAALAAEMENVPLDPRVPMEPPPGPLKPREAPSTIPETVPA